jgi:hypothetical protein
MFPKINIHKFPTIQWTQLYSLTKKANIYRGTTFIFYLTLNFKNLVSKMRITITFPLKTFQIILQAQLLQVGACRILKKSHGGFSANIKLLPVKFPTKIVY